MCIQIFSKASEVSERSGKWNFFSIYPATRQYGPWPRAPSSGPNYFPLQNKAYRERKKQELIQLRRLAALHKEREQKEEYENDVNKLVKNVDHTSESDGEL